MIIYKSHRELPRIFLRHYSSSPWYIAAAIHGKGRAVQVTEFFLTMCSSFILLTWPHHFSRFSVIFLDACTTLVVPLMCSFRILSLLVTPHMHLSILISLTSSHASCPLVVAQVSAPYNRTGVTTVL